MNDFEHHSGGTDTTSYAPAYSWATSSQTGFILKNHTEIGHVDFREDNSMKIVLWHSKNLKVHSVMAPSLKGVVQAITHFVGRMKPLPTWTQKGAIVGL